MSGFVAYYTINGFPCDHLLLNRMATVLAHYGRTHGMWSAGEVGLAMADWHEAQVVPYRSPADACVVAADVRLDYRADLLARLAAAGRPLQDPSDAELIASAYMHWGQACITLLEGDYAFLLWDNDRRCLFGARSVSGLRPFVFTRCARSVVCASEAKMLFLDPSVRTQLNDRWIAHWLTTGLHAWDCTIYQTIEKLPPGYTITIDSDGVHTQRFWPPAQVGTRSALRQDEVVEALRTRLFAAVQSRLSQSHPTLIDISGGLDSSSLACIAGKLRPSSRELPSLYGLHAYSARIPENDDRVRAAQVAEQTGIPLLSLSYDDDAPLDGLFLPKAWSDTPSLPTIFFARLYEHIWQTAAMLQVQRHIRGDFGDQLFDRSSLYLRQLSQEHRSLQLMHEIWTWHRGGTVSASRVLAHSLLLPWWRTIYPRVPVSLQERAPWLREPIRRLGMVYQDEETDLLRQLIPDPLARHLYQAILSHDESVAMQHDGYIAAGIETCEPYADERLLSFMMACPPHLSMRFGTRKFLLRETMQPLLPEAIWTRRGKGRIARVLFAAIARHHQTLRQLVLAMPEMLDPFMDATHLAQAVDAAAQGAALDQKTFLSALALVLWCHRLPWSNGHLPGQES